MSGKNSTFLNNNPPTVDDVWLNMVTSEVKNFITNTGQTPTDADLFQIAKGVANAASVSNFYTDSGTTNSYVLTPVTPFKAPDAYRNGMEIRFRAGNANSGSSTINVAGLGSVAIKKADGVTDVVAGEIPSTQDTKLRYNASVFILSNDSVLAASQGEVDAGVVTDKFVAPSTLRFGFAASFTPNGYIAFPSWLGGLIIQWGTSVNTGTSTLVTFPIPFPTTVRHISYGNVPSSLLTAGNYYQIGHNNLSLLGFNWGGINSAGVVNSTPSTMTALWLGIGV